MSVVKSITSKKNSKAALKGTLNYVFKESKTKQELCYVTGDYMELEITAGKIFRSFMETKEAWGKTGGRMCKHFVISWHEDSPVTHEQALEMCKEWAEKVFPDFSCAIAIHTDRNHVHGHIVVNSVSFVDGKKYHMEPRELEASKKINDEINLARGFTIVEKGKQYDGSDIEEGTIHSYKKDTYNALVNTDRNNSLSKIATAILTVKSYVTSQEDFISELFSKHGIEVTWAENRKYITFCDLGTKVKARNKKLGETFSIDLSKEALLDEFERNERLQNQQLKQTAKLDEERELLAERVQEASEGIKEAKPDNRTTAGSDSPARSGGTKASLGEYGTERINEEVAESVKKSTGLIRWSKGIIATFTDAISRLKDLRTKAVTAPPKQELIPKQELTPELKSEGEMLSFELSNIRNEIILNLIDTQLRILDSYDNDGPYIKSRYQALLEQLYKYQHTIIEVTPIVSSYAISLMKEHTPPLGYLVNKAMLAIFNHDEDEVTSIAKECILESNKMLSDVPQAMENIARDHNIEIEPIVTRTPPRRSR